MSFTTFKVIGFIVVLSAIIFGFHLLFKSSKNQNNPSTEKEDLNEQRKEEDLEENELEIEDLGFEVREEMIHHLEEPSFSTNSSRIKSREYEGYLIRSPSCSILDVDPWHESVVDVMPPVALPNCSNLPPLTAIEEDTLIVVQDRKRLYSYDEEVTCCYKRITKKDYKTHYNEYEDDMFYLSSECLLVREKVKLSVEDEFLLVNCYTQVKHVYSNVHARVTILENVKRKIKESSNNQQKNMNVLVFVIHSFSRLNFIRKMPKSMHFFENNGWVELRAYNEWDANGFPTIVKSLTGLNFDKFKEICKYPEIVSDDCPLIWKDFSRHGFITCYGEDGNNIGKVFNSPLSGFAQQPTDYYLRPFFLAADHHINDTYNYGGKTICLGPSLQVELVYSYALEFSKTFRNNPFFGIFKVNTLSFFDLKLHKSLDELTFDLLTKLYSYKILNNTFIVFMSDHGFRHKSLSKLHVGWLEERLPFSFIWVPEAYRKLYPDKYFNLLSNRDKLTSSFDLHLTLREVLTGKSEKGTESCPQCVSLFQDLPWNRSCESAGISEEACACSRYLTLDTLGKYSQLVVNKAVSRINRSLRKTSRVMRGGATCAVLTAKRILSAWSEVQSGGKYVITFETEPSQAVYQANFMEGRMLGVEGITRINFNSEQSKCLADNSLKRFCYCEYEKQ